VEPAEYQSPQFIITPGAHMQAIINNEISYISTHPEGLIKKIKKTKLSLCLIKYKMELHWRGIGRAPDIPAFSTR
jgi:hypothetical protein